MLYGFRTLPTCGRSTSMELFYVFGNRSIKSAKDKGNGFAICKRVMESCVWVETQTGSYRF